MSFRIRLQLNIQRTHIYFVRRILFLVCSVYVPFPHVSPLDCTCTSTNSSPSCNINENCKRPDTDTCVCVYVLVSWRENGWKRGVAKGHAAMTAPLFTKARNEGELFQNWTIFLAICSAWFSSRWSQIIANYTGLNVLAKLWPFNNEKGLKHIKKISNKCW